MSKAIYVPKYLVMSETPNSEDTYILQTRGPAALCWIDEDSALNITLSTWSPENKGLGDFTKSAVKIAHIYGEEVSDYDPEDIESINYIEGKLKSPPQCLMGYGDERHDIDAFILVTTPAPVLLAVQENLVDGLVHIFVAELWGRPDAHDLMTSIQKGSEYRAKYI